MNTSRWGPGAWEFTHTIMANAPDELNKEEQKKYKNFFILFGKMLPCKYCRSSYEKFMEVYPIDNYMDSGYLLQWWWYNIHNFVNKKLKKDPKKTPKFKKVFKKYNSYKSTKS